MGQVAVMEQENIPNKRQTFVRRVSDLFKDGTYSGPPTLFGHTSMQKLRHCCQNLNLFPYLLYSLDNSKPHPLAKKVNIRIKKMVEHIFIVYTSFRHFILREICSEKLTTKILPEKRVTNQLSARIFRSIKKKPKKISYFLLMAIYLVPLILAFQLVAIGSLLALESHTPGFVFLVTALICLGYISMKVMIGDKTARKIFKNEKRKTE